MKSILLIAQLGGAIEWRLAGTTSEPRLPLLGFPGWSMRHPLCWSDHEREFAGWMVDGYIDSELFASSRGLSFAFDGDANDHLPAESLDTISHVLRRLRFVARQFSVPQMVAAVSRNEGIPSGPPVEPPPHDFSQAFIRNYRLPTALTDQHLRDVASMSADFLVPVYADVLLDALEAHVEQDFRKALLYAAIAVESYARERLGVEMRESLLRTDGRHRTISLPTAGGGTSTKDPVAELLIDGDGLRLTQLLHETALYIRGRSLLLDEPTTYRDVARLYATRNKIAHVGTPTNHDKQFPATQKGSETALRAAVAAVSWLGDPGPYVVWDGRLVSAADGTALF